MGIGMPISQASAPFMGVLLMVGCQDNAGLGGLVPCRVSTVDKVWTSNTSSGLTTGVRAVLTFARVDLARIRARP